MGGAEEEVLMGIDEWIGMEKCAWSGILPLGDMLSAEVTVGNQRIKAINAEIACVVRKVGGTFISNCEDYPHEGRFLPAPVKRLGTLYSRGKDDASKKNREGFRRYAA